MRARAQDGFTPGQAVGREVDKAPAQKGGQHQVGGDERRRTSWEAHELTLQPDDEGRRFRGARINYLTVQPLMVWPLELKIPLILPY